MVCRKRSNSSLHLLQRGRPAEIGDLGCAATAHQMNVVVDEAGKDRAARCIDDVRVGPAPAPYLLAAADGDDRVFTNSQGFMESAATIRREHLAVR